MGIVHVSYSDEKLHDDYISNIVDNHFEAFINLCWTNNSNSFLRTLCKLMAGVKLTDPSCSPSPPPRRRDLHNATYSVRCRAYALLPAST
jgi:hypothetical protein